MIFTARADGWMDIGAAEPVRCALGRGGVIAAADKREGDGASPAGVWPIRKVFFRGRLPKSSLPRHALRPEDGWCDAPEDPCYNRPVRHPYPASAERLWRDDGLYDRIVVLGHNDDPVVPGLGSAIFLHIAREGYAPTEGCVALSAEDLEAFLARAKPGDAVEIWF